MSSFPLNPTDGELFTTDLGTTYSYKAAVKAWRIVGQTLIGATGVDGATGIQGDTGLYGPIGLTGPQGVQGVTGPYYGPPGVTGFPGPTGAQGVTGPYVVYNNLMDLRASSNRTIAEYAPMSPDNQSFSGDVYPYYLEVSESGYRVEHSLLKWPVVLTADATVSTAVVKVNTPLYTVSFGQAYQMTKPWTESASWGTYDGTHGWDASGAEGPTDYVNAPLILSQSPVDHDGFMSLTLNSVGVSLVQSWIRGDTSNLGIMLAIFPDSGGVDQQQFSSRFEPTVTHRPELIINYAQHGLQGATGVAMPGPTGVQGVTGLVGQTGVQGMTGPRGLTGIGAQGQTGVQGPTGFQGQTGIQGRTGVAGSTGVQGVQGNTGVQGNIGLQGNTGVQGVQGNPSSSYYDLSSLGTVGTYYGVPVAPDGTMNRTGTLSGHYGVLWNGFNYTPVDATVRATWYSAYGDPSPGNDSYGQYVVPFEWQAAGSVMHGSLDMTCTVWMSDATKGLTNLLGTYTNHWPDISVGGDRVVWTFLDSSHTPSTGRLAFRMDSSLHSVTGNPASNYFGLVTYDISPYANMLGVVAPTSGLPGITGMQGLTGAGFQGLTGSQGQTGIQGSTGASGQTGVAGQTGFQGATGVGSQGQTGVAGTTGATGQTGVAGQTGIAGINGLPGLTGVQGQTGISGTSGGTGIQGVTGLSGTSGGTGVQGVTGLGTTGIQGITGIRANQNIDGGDAASVYTPPQVVDGGFSI